jgi:hypothetical protein
MKIAAITMVYNEPAFLRLWAAHYGREFGAENLFCIDHASDDGSTAGVVRNTIRVPRGVFDERRRATAVSDLCGALLAFYDVVVFSDCDEFLVADPQSFTGLRDLIGKREAKTMAALGFDVVQSLASEPGIDLGAPILAQRRFARFARRYCKPLVTRTPLRWLGGFHVAREPSQPDRALFLFHLRYVDEATFRASQATRLAISFSPDMPERGLPTQWRIGIEQRIRTEFLDSDPADAPEMIDLAPDESLDAWINGPRRRKIYRIPDRFRGAIPGVAPMAASPAATAAATATTVNANAAVRA